MLSLNYPEKLLGIKTKAIDFSLLNLPYYILDRYELQLTTFDSLKVLLIHPKIKLEDLKLLKTHLQVIKKEYKIPLVVILDKLTFRQKEYLLKEKIPFIVNDKQIYLPFLATYLQERSDSEDIEKENLLPSAQLLLFYFIYNKCNEITTIQASKQLELTPTSISRATKQLEQLDILHSKKDGVNKILSFDGKPSDLFKKSKDFLINPVKKTIYLAKNELKGNFLMSNLSALSEWSLLSEPKLKYYATDNTSLVNENFSEKLIDSEDQIAIELWRYNPKILTNTNMVDKLSLCLSINEGDERIEIAKENILNKLWEELDG